MQRHSHALASTLSTALVLLWVSNGAVYAADCSDTDARYTVELYEAAANTSACEAYAVVTASQVYISGPCTAAACMEIMEAVAEKLPDCEYSGVNEKQELQASLANCPQSSSVSSSASASASSVACTAEEYQETTELYEAAAITTECAPYASTSSSEVTIYSPCSATGCVTVLKQMAVSLPDCKYNDINEKQELLDGLSVCTGISTSMSEDTTEPPATSKALCTDTEVSYMTEKFSTIASSAVCVNDSRIYAYVIDVYTTCESACAITLGDLALELPDCYYGFENANKKAEVQNAVAKCEAATKLQYAYVSFSPDDPTTNTTKSIVDNTTAGIGATDGSTLSSSAVRYKAHTPLDLVLVAAVVLALHA